MIKKISIFLMVGVVLLSMVPVQAQTAPVHKFGDGDLQKNWTVKLKEAEIIQYKGKTALHLKEAKGPGLALLKDTEFVNGVIEVDIAAIPKFTGIVFRVVDEYTYEGIYFRPQNSRDPQKRNETVQYISHPRYTWNYLRETFPGKYEAAADIAPEEWFHVRVEVMDQEAKVFVNNSQAPCLVVSDLKRGISKGAVGVWCGNESGGTFANFSVKLMKTDKPLSTPPDMQQRKEIKLDAKVFSAYIGKYQMAENPEFFVTIFTENGLFYTQATAQPRFQIFAESENKFFLKAVDAQVTFIKGDKGIVTELAVFQNGNEVRFKKVE
ncbi:MAG: hypothetical protein QG657_3292 [Acidobacteriota bacterium]|nr:hypothetical protein [Acidobacteriota bacterium]